MLNTKYPVSLSGTLASFSSGRDKGRNMQSAGDRRVGEMLGKLSESYQKHARCRCSMQRTSGAVPARRGLGVTVSDGG